MTARDRRVTTDAASRGVGQGSYGEQGGGGDLKGRVYGGYTTLDTENRGRFGGREPGSVYEGQNNRQRTVTRNLRMCSVKQKRSLLYIK